MIHFALRCKPQGHGFDGWFRSNADFERQALAGLLECPVCGTAHVEKALMRPAIGRGGADVDASVARPAAPVAPSASVPTPVASPVPPEVAKAFAALQDMTRKLRASAQDVGKGFAEEARRIHYGETDARQIYGEATTSEVKALAEEGIKAIPLPPLPEDGN